MCKEISQNGKKDIRPYIQWRKLLYCGIGLWLALCANDLYYGACDELLLFTDKIFPTTATTHQVAIETDDTLMSISHFIEKGQKSWGTIRKSRILTTCVVIFASIWSILFTLCFQEYMRNKLQNFVNAECLTEELNFDKKKSTSTSIQVSCPSPFTSTILHYVKDEKRSRQEWLSTTKASLHTVSYTFKEETNERRIICKSLEKCEKEIRDSISNNKYDKQKIECLYNESYTYQCEPVFQLIHYINLSRSVHFHSTLLSQRYTISIFNTFSSLSVKYLFNSLPARYSLKKNDFFDGNNRREINVNKLKILNWSLKKNTKISMSECFGKTTGYISSSPAFQQFLANFMNNKYIQPSYV